MRRGQLRCSFILAMRAYLDLERDHSLLSDRQPPVTWPSRLYSPTFLMCWNLGLAP